MLNYALKRLGVAILVAITVSMVTFSLLYLTGDPAMALAGESATSYCGWLFRLQRSGFRVHLQGYRRGL